MRAVRGAPGFVEAWTVNSVDNLKLYLRLGVNGLICDPEGIERVRDLLQHGELGKRYRLADRSDDPMVPDNFAYGLTVVTTDKRLAGTDASVAFTLSGDSGSASTTVDASLHHRLESGSIHYFVLYSPDLGTLRSITVQSDRSHLAPGWHLHSIVVESSRYGGKKTPPSVPTMHEAPPGPGSERPEPRIPIEPARPRSVQASWGVRSQCVPPDRHLAQDAISARSASRSPQ